MVDDVVVREKEDEYCETKEQNIETELQQTLMCATVHTLVLLASVSHAVRKEAKEWKKTRKRREENTERRMNDSPLRRCIRTGIPWHSRHLDETTIGDCDSLTLSIDG